MSSENSYIAPSSSNWINKYFDLVDNKKIELDSFFSNNSEEELFEIVISRSGLVFGTAEKLIFSQHLDIEKYTHEEALKLLFFEALIFIQINHEGNFDKIRFINDLNTFYANFNSDFWRLNLKFGKEDQIQKLESTINARIKVKSNNVLDTNFWLNSFSNILCIVDVLLFDEFKRKKIKTINDRFDLYNYKLIRGIILAAKLDEKIQKSEKQIINRFLRAANLAQMYETDLIQFLDKENLSQDDFHITFENPRIAKIAYILVIFITEGTHTVGAKEANSLKRLGKSFGLTSHEISECKISCRSFLYSKTDGELNLAGSNINHNYKDFSSKWIRILGRNKEKLSNELAESKELMQLIKKSTKEDLSKEEKEKIKKQFLDLLKAMPSVGIFLLPGGTILLPIILKIVPDLLPSTFKENKTEEK